MKIKSIRGFKDILPSETARWQFIEDSTKNVFEKYGFSEIRLPVLENTEVFTSGLGNTTDIVEKEMYTFQDRDGSSITMRPEGTAGLVRSFIENSLHLKMPVNKLYYIGTMFRHERPQKGRYRGFNQIGAELFGSDTPYSDADLISMLWNTFEELELSKYVELEINSIGLPEDRLRYKEEIIDYFNPSKEKLCKDCQRKLKNNPLRVFDCKNSNCQEIALNAPSILDYLPESSKVSFEKLLDLLEKINIPFKINNRIVRGLDYYTNTVFELTTNQLGSQNAVAAGGRYDLLVEQLGGPKMPAIGFAIGLERLVLLHEIANNDSFNNPFDIYIACMGEDAHDEGIKIANILRKKGFRAEISYDDKSFKSQLKRANKSGAKYCIIIGDDELKNNKIKLRNMELSEESEILISELDKLEL